MFLSGLLLKHLGGWQEFVHVVDELVDSSNTKVAEGTINQITENIKSKSDIVDSDVINILMYYQGLFSSPLLSTKRALIASISSIEGVVIGVLRYFSRFAVKTADNIATDGPSIAAKSIMYAIISGGVLTLSSLFPGILGWISKSVGILKDMALL